MAKPTLVIPTKLNSAPVASLPRPVPIHTPVPEPVQEQRPSLMNKDVSLSLNVRTVVSVVVILFLMSSSFLVGRYVFPSGKGAGLGGAEAAAVVDAQPATEAASTEPIESSGSSESSDITGLTEASNTSEKAEEAPVAEEAASTGPAASTAAVVTSYGNVALSFSRVPDFKWFEEDGYGKITTLWYTIVNNEDGIIQPEKFRIRLEGYDDLEDIKLAAVPGPDKSIDPGETVSHGFDKLLQYSVTKTDPSNIRITLELLDEKDQVIATASQEFNLKS